MRRAGFPALAKAALLTAVLSLATPSLADGSAQPALIFSPEWDIRRASGLIQNEMGFYLLEYTSAGRGHAESELVNRLARKASSLTYLLLSKQMFGKAATPMLPSEKQLNAVADSELIDLRAQLANVRRGDVNAFYAADSRWSARYEKLCHAAERNATP